MLSGGIQVAGLVQCSVGVVQVAGLGPCSVAGTQVTGLVQCLLGYPGYWFGHCSNQGWATLVGELDSCSTMLWGSKVAELRVLVLLPAWKIPGGDGWTAPARDEV